MPSKNEKSQRESGAAQADSGRGNSRGSSQMDTVNRSQELQSDSGNVTAEGETSRHVADDMSPMGRADESTSDSEMESSSQSSSRGESRNKGAGTKDSGNYNNN